jgi:hypothetical protein
MSGRDPIGDVTLRQPELREGADLLQPLLESASSSSEGPQAIAGVLIGELVAIGDEGRTPLILYPGQPGTAVIAARSTVDLHGAHIGKQLVLMFEGGDPLRPIVLGVLSQGEGWPLPERPGQVELDVDGERMTVSAREQLVLRCGKASVTLTRAGKVLIQGTYVSSRSSGVNRVKGGSIQLN